MKKDNRKANAILGGGLFGAGLASTIALNVNATNVIIAAGIGALRMSVIAGGVVTVVGAAMATIATSSIISEKKKQEKSIALDKEAREEAIRRKKEDVRGLVTELMNEEEDFIPVGQVLMKEMDDMDEFAERSDKLFEFNDMKEFESMKEIISQAKSALYHNCRGIVNLYVALENSGEFATESQKILDSNKEIRDNAKKFLLELARYTNEQNEDTDAVTMIQDYADAIGQSLRHTYN
ncbi:hypothetical protein [Butyrivibrio sp. MC2021]|uniref:hypothetical protein n=1 Tax=Butyrivibrio sp. MC2021 TaxID=1408306 RepID=UPI00047AD88E|nr:hypothetical protein [Butyrivibrio sp. MC2021]